MSLHNPLGDVETKSHTSSIILGKLEESHEHRLQLVGGDSRARVTDGKANLISDACDVDHTLPFFDVNLIALLRRLLST